MTNISVKPENTSSLAGSLRGSLDCTPEGTAPAREDVEITEFCVPLDLKTAQDPAPTTTCERGLGPISGVRHKTSGLPIHGRGRKKVSRVGVVLQERDRELLRVCYEQQFILAEQVVRFFFRGVGKRNAYQRLFELERAGLIRWVDDPMLDRNRLIRLTRKGLQIISEAIIIEVPQVHKPDIKTLRHDSFVTSIRLRLQEIWTGSWIPERALKQQDFPQIPDGVFIFPSGKKVAVEVENSVKPRPRLLGIFERWRRVDVELVLYVVTGSAIQLNVQNAVKQGPRMVPLAVVRYHDLLAGTPKVWTPDGDVDVFSRKEY